MTISILSRVTFRYWGLAFLALPALAQADYYQIEGLEGDILDNVELVLDAQSIRCSEGEMENSQSTETYLKEQVQKAIQPYGYYSPTINVTFKKLNDDECVAIKVKQGSPTKIRKLDVKLTGSGQDEALLTTILDDMALKQGQVFLDEQYQSLKSQLKVAALDYGYLDSQFTTAQVDVYTEAEKADVQLVFDTGVRYKISEIRVKQNKPDMKPEYLEKMIDLRPGDWVESQNLVDAREQLSATKYFSSVFLSLDLDERRTEVENGKTIGLVPLQVNTFYADRMKHAFSIGYSTDTGPRVGYQFNHYRINDAGDQLTFDTSISQLSQEVSVNLMRPSRKEPTKVKYNLGLGYMRDENQDVTNEAYKIGINQTRDVSSFWDNINYLDLSYQVDDYGDTTEDFWLLVPGVSWDYIRVDNARRPRDGVKWHLNLQGATEYLVSDTSFVQVNIGNRAVIGTFDRQRILTRLTVGQTWVVENRNLPSSYRYFVGGDSSVRGYAYESIAPQDDESTIAGGKNKVVGSVEYEFGMPDDWGRNWALAAFVDAGTAYNNEFDFKTGAGVGVRWFSPVGPIRLDVGHPLDKDASNDFRIHFTLGSDF